MLQCFRTNRPCLPTFWIDFVLNRTWCVLLFMLTATVLLGGYSVLNFRIDTDLTEMVSDDLQFRKDQIEFRDTFPHIGDSLAIVIDAPTPEEAEFVRDMLTQRFRSEPSVFRSVFAPGEGDFYDKNGLLYLDKDELYDFTDNLAAVQPFLGLLSSELSLANLFTALSDVMEQTLDDGAADLDPTRLDALLAELSASIALTTTHETSWMSWRTVMSGEAASENAREFIVLWPYLDYTALNPVKKTISSINKAKEAVHDLDLSDVTVRMTGNLAMRVDNLLSATKGIGASAAVSFALVGVLLALGLKSFRLVTLTLTCLLVGLIWTMGFAMVSVGRLNMISVTFVVLFIGLGIDYGIQFCLRYRELLKNRVDHDTAIRRAYLEVGNALLLCTLSTALGFFAFVPTEYIGASELGIIACGGMFINLFINLTLLPALLHVTRRRSNVILDWDEPSMVQEACSLPERRPVLLLTCAGALCLAAAITAGRVSFDSNPFNLSDQSAESVLTAKELFTNSKTSPWTASILYDSLEQAKAAADRLEKSPLVQSTLTLSDLEPSNQQEKLDVIAEAALFLPTIPSDTAPVETSAEAVSQALSDFKDHVERAALERPQDFPAAQRLAASLENLLSETSQTRLDNVREALLAPLGMLLHRLNRLMQAEGFELRDLPAELKANYVSKDTYRVQAFPAENLFDAEALERFVNGIREIEPHATSSPIVVYESGAAISRAFIRAFVIAIVTVSLLLVVVTRSPRTTALILTPLAASLLLTVGVMGAAGTSFNFANIIVAPLILGIGIDYGIHLVHRRRTDPRGSDLLRTSTARGVLFSALTTAVSFAGLVASDHAGTSGMGLLLFICLIIMIICSLTILPAALSLWDKGAGHGDSPQQG